LQLVLLGTFLAGGCYFFLVPRHLDAFTVAFFSAAIYFLPGLVGYTLSPATPDMPIKLPVEIAPEALGIMIAVLATIAVAAIIWDRFAKHLRPPGWRLEEARSASAVALMLAAAGLLLDAAETGGLIFAPDKRVVMEQVGRGHIIWEMGASIAAVTAFRYRQHTRFLLAAVLLTVDMWIGFRYAFALTLVAVLWMSLRRPRPFRLASLRLRYLLLVLLGGLVVISYQNLKEPIRTGNWPEVVRRTTNPLWYIDGILTSEPFTTQTVMNEIVRRDFRTSTDHLWGASTHLLLFSPSLDAETVRFNDLYQPALFPMVDHGLANNIWAQLWSATGWPGLFVFLGIFVALLAAGSWVIRSPDPGVQAGATLFFAYWAFYIHRNELIVQLGYQKHVVLVWALCTFVGTLIDHPARNGPRAKLAGPP
jgi:hypothetical protein